MCDNGHGGATPCYNSGGLVIAPKVFLGHSTPTFDGSFSNTFTFFKNWRLSAMLDAASDYKRLDNNIRIRCQIFHTCLEYVQPQNTDPKLLAQYFSGGPLRDFTIRDASYIKFRELSLSYDVPVELYRAVRRPWRDAIGLRAQPRHVDVLYRATIPRASSSRNGSPASRRPGGASAAPHLGLHRSPELLSMPGCACTPPNNRRIQSMRYNTEARHVIWPRMGRGIAASLAGLAIAAGFITACNTSRLLDVTTPNAVPVSLLDDPTNADLMVASAVEQYEN